MGFPAIWRRLMALLLPLLLTLTPRLSPLVLSVAPPNKWPRFTSVRLSSATSTLSTEPLFLWLLALLPLLMCPPARSTKLPALSVRSSRPSTELPPPLLSTRPILRVLIPVWSPLPPRKSVRSLRLTPLLAICTMWVWPRSPPWPLPSDLLSDLASLLKHSLYDPIV